MHTTVYTCVKKNDLQKVNSVFVIGKENVLCLNYLKGAPSFCWSHKLTIRFVTL